MSSIAKFDVEKFDGSNDFGLWRVKMRCLLIQHGWEAALDPFPETMTDADKTAALKTDVYKKAHSALLLCLDNKVLREVNKENSATRVWLKLETLYMTKSLANKLYLKKKLFTFYMDSGKKLSEHIDEFNKLVGDLANIDVEIDDEDQTLMLLTSLPSLYDNFLKKRTDAKDDGDGLYVRGRSDHRGSPKERLSKKEQEEINWLCKEECETGFCGSFHMTPRRNFLFDFKEFNGSTVLLGNNRACAIMRIGKVRVQMKDGSSFVLENVRYIPELKRNLISLGTLDREGYTVKLQNGRVKMIKGSLMVLSGTMKENCVYSLDGWAESGEASVGIQEKESLAPEINSLCKESGIARHLTVARTPQQNGLAERMNRTLLNKVRCLLIESGLPDSFWAEVTVTAAYLINRSPSTALEKKTPMDLWSGHLANYEMLRIFGCVAYSHVNQGKLKPRAIKCIFLWYSCLCEGYDYGAKDKTIVPAKYRDEEDTHEPITFQEAINSFENDEWVRAMKEEMSSLKKNHTWELVDQPPGQKLISCKWLYKIKEGIEGVQKPRYKARVGDSLIDCFEALRVGTLDVRTRFCMVNLEDTILCGQPTCFEKEHSKNDMLIACKSKSEIEYTKGLLRKEFDMKELGPARKILGMEIVRDRGSRTLKVSQSGYVQKILNNYRMDNGKSVSVPLETLSRPDIAYVVSIVSRYLANPGLVYGRDQGKHVDVDGFVDADYAKDPDKGRSITGYVFMVHGCVVSWKATLQHVVALSTTEAEYMALTEAVKESIWLKGLLIELGVNLREIVESKEIGVAKISIKDNAADAFTKVVPGPKFKYCMEILGVGAN
ncbi:zinc finger, CCHC-type containing protein [Tanacetum coccineum]|uniref:Zinc finger, CCHC-type containing protein n=1 Tax=Tanacetum coccineum TaxID=301880 RepID=A0ABQ5DNQ3_9ASTR